MGRIDRKALRAGNDFKVFLTSNAQEHPKIHSEEIDCGGCWQDITSKNLD